MRWRLATVLTVTALVGFAGSRAEAADPQILGLVASNGALPVTCGDEICAVELSAFCMQERAPVPPVGTPYAPTAETRTSIGLSAETPDGRRVALPADIARFASARSNRAVRLEFSRAELAARGLSRPTVEIDTRAAVVPLTLLSRIEDEAVASEIALVTGPLREVAERVVDQAGAGTVAAQITNRLINGVPDDAVGDVADRAALWRQTLADAAPSLVRDDEGVALAREAFDRCAGLPGGGFITFRQCLAARHDIFLSPQNRAYWDAVQTGS